MTMMVLSCRHSFPLFKRVTNLIGRKEISGGVVACNNNNRFVEWFSTTSSSDIFISPSKEEKNGFFLSPLSSLSSFMLLPLLYPISSTISTTKAITESKSMFDTTDNAVLSDPFEDTTIVLGDDDEYTTNNKKYNNIWTMNRNARKPKKANKGARPCSRASRRRKKEKIGKRRR